MTHKEKKLLSIGMWNSNDGTAIVGTVSGTSIIW